MSSKSFFSPWHSHTLGAPDFTPPMMAPYRENWLLGWQVCRTNSEEQLQSKLVFMLHGAEEHLVV
jgi:hypothetical protein